MTVLELDHVTLPTAYGRPAPTPRAQAIRGEYLEIPQLSLTRTQVQSFWDLSDGECDEVLDGLLACGFLKVTSNGGFVRS
jgi:hypothetical protein